MKFNDTSDIDAIKEECKKFNLKYYTPTEEILNTITHGIGIPLGLVGLIFMLIKSTTILDYLASIFFCLPVMFVFGVSAVYHALTDFQKKSKLRRLDHGSIPFIVLACSAPFAFGLTSNPLNYIGFGVCVAIAISCLILCVKDLKKFQYFAMVMNYVIGVIMTAVFWINRSLVPINVKYLYLAGLLLCIGGSIIYSIKKRYVHTVFHIFELVGTILFYIGGYIL